MDPLTLAMGLAQFAPKIAKWITGSDNAAAGVQKVVDIASQVTGITGDPAKMLEAMQADKALQIQFQQRVMENDTELERLFLADMQSARARDVELHKAGYGNTRADLMVLLDVVGLIACLAVIALYRNQLPGEVVGIISTVAGIFGACLRDAHQFEFGSSRSSREKDGTISRLAR